MMDFNRFQKELELSLGDSIVESVSKRLGNPLLPANTDRINVPLTEVDQPGMVYIHDDGGDPQSVSMALNSGPGKLPDMVYGDPILVKRTNKGWVVAGVDYHRWAEYRYNVVTRPQTSVVLGQFDFGLLQPTSPRSMKCVVSGATYHLNGVPYKVRTQETQDFTSEIPSTAGMAKGGLITIDPTTSALAYTFGSEFDATLSDDAAFTTFYPQNTDDTLFTVGRVKLVNGMVVMLEGVHIYAGQELLSKGAAGGGGAGAVEDVFCARLSLQSGEPVTSGDVTAADTLYLTPYNGNRVTLYNSLTSLWETVAFTEIALSIAALNADTMYDVFAYLDSGAAAIEVLAWSDVNTRATNYAWQDGRRVKSGDATRRLIGSICMTSASGESECSIARMFICNLFNPLPRELRFESTDNTWSYGSSTWRQANGSSSYQVEYISCVDDHAIDVQLQALVLLDGGEFAAIGIGMDSPSNQVAKANASSDSGNAAIWVPVTIMYKGKPGIGYHALIWAEYVQSGTVDFYGVDGTLGTQSVLTATVWG